MSGSHQYGEPAIGPVSSRLPGVAGNRVEEFVTLLGQHQRRLHLFVWSLVPNVADAEDILQETNLVLWREFHQFQAGTNFISWASTVAFNQVLAWRKRKQRERLVFSDVFLSAVSAELGETADLLEERVDRIAALLSDLARREPPAPGRSTLGVVLQLRGPAALGPNPASSGTQPSRGPGWRHCRLPMGGGPLAGQRGIGL